MGTICQSRNTRAPPGFDAVKQLILCRIERRPARLDLSAYPYLPKPNVGKTRAADYSALLEGAAA